MGAIVVRIRLPGAITFGPRAEKFFISLFRRIPVPSTTTFAPKKSERVCVSATMLPWRSTTDSDVVLGGSSFPITAGAMVGETLAGSISAARFAAYSRDSRYGVGTAVNSGSPTNALKSANPRFIDSASRWMCWGEKCGAFATLIGLGHLRAIVGDPEARLDVVPVDEVTQRITHAALLDDAPVMVRHAVAGLARAPRVR